MNSKTYYYYDEDLDAIGECDETNVQVVEDYLAYGDFQVFDCLCDAEEKMGWEREWRKAQIDKSMLQVKKDFEARILLRSKYDARSRGLTIDLVKQTFDQIYYMN